jgi:beta-N-acetylglucosaminidase
MKTLFSTKTIVAIAVLSILSAPLACSMQAGVDTERSSEQSAFVACAARVVKRTTSALETPVIYPSPRFVNVSRNGVPANTFCVDPAAKIPASTLDEAARQSALSLVPWGSCACDWTISASASAAVFSAQAKDTLRVANNRDGVYAFKTDVASNNRVRTQIQATSPAAKAHALRKALSFTTGAVGALASEDSEMADYPSVSHRGIVEGFYGRNYTKEQRTRLLSKMGYLRMNAYLYAPKCDCSASALNWRDDYPSGAAPAWNTTEPCPVCEQNCQVVSREDLQAAVTDAERYGVRFIWGISPYRGRAFDASTYGSELAALKRKITYMRSIGVREFALLTDDTGSTAGSGGSAGLARDHARLAKDVAAFLKTFDASARMLFVGVTYSGNADAYTNVLGTELSPSIDVMWTGKAVVPDTIETRDLTSINGSLRRKVTIWDNWGTGRFEGREASLPSAISGFFTNPVASECKSGDPQTSEPDVLEIERSLGTIADYLWDADTYMKTYASGDASHARWLQILPRLD